MAGWTLIPDKIEVEEKPDRSNALISTLISFFFAEMGDKTQIATIGLAAAHPGATLQVVLGSTLGMMLANVPVVFLGNALAGRLNLSYVRFVAALLFALFGGWVLWFGVG